MRKSLTIAVLLAAISMAMPIHAEHHATTPSTTMQDSLPVEENYTNLTPQSDFYTYVNQDWLKTAKIPKGKPSTGSFYILRENTEDQVQSMLKELNQNYDSLAKDSDTYKLVEFYRMALDFPMRNALGFAPIKPLTTPVASAKTIDELNEAMMTLIKDGQGTILQFDMDTDLKDSTYNIIYVEPPFVGLDKVFLEKDDAYSQKLRTAYKEYMIDLFTLNGDTKEEASKKADLVLTLDGELASAIAPKEEESNFDAKYNPMTWEELQEKAPNIPFYKGAQSMGIIKDKRIIVTEPKAIEKLNTLYTEEHLPAFKAQLEFYLLSNYAYALSKDAIEAQARFKEAATGAYDLPSDEKLATKLTLRIFGPLIGKLYVEKYFSPEYKKDVLDIVHEIIATYEQRIEKVDWMSPETKAKAIDKVKHINVKIGYPDKWLSYNSVVIRDYYHGGNLISNIQSVDAMELKEELSHLNKEPDRTKWGMNPQTVNAYYNPLANEIVFPAAILQPPFYNPKGSREENLGGIGAVIGHEISHAFDVSGAQYDVKGNLHNWWTKDDYDKFQKKVDKAAAFYSAYEVLPGYHINGKISTGEVFGDLGGLTIAIQIAKNEHLDTKKVFESYARIWRNKTTRKALIARLIDEHPPGKYRVNGIVTQIPEFYKDFNVKPGDAMYVAPEKRFKVW